MWTQLAAVDCSVHRRRHNVLDALNRPIKKYVTLKYRGRKVRPAGQIRPAETLFLVQSVSTIYQWWFNIRLKRIFNTAPTASKITARFN
jgi:hypothetical protein